MSKTFCKVVSVESHSNLTGVEMWRCTLECGAMRTVRRYKHRNVENPKPKRFQCDCKTKEHPNHVLDMIRQDTGFKTNRQLVEEGNALSRKVYQSMGYQVPEGYRFDEANHPQERGMWNIAVIAYDHIEGTDLENALDCIDED